MMVRVSVEVPAAMSEVVRAPDSGAESFVSFRTPRAPIPPRTVPITAVNAKIMTVEGYRLSALGVLEGAKLVMDGFKGMNTNPDLHPKVASLIATKGTALITLEGAKKTLDGVKWTLGATGKVASFAIEKSVDGLINIRKIDFAGKLGSISGGSVKLNTELEWLGKKKKTSKQMTR